MKTLRCGFSTGSAAAAGTKAALLVVGGQTDVQMVNIPLPDGQRLDIPIATIQSKGDLVTSTVIKDAGDDPDVTHQARIIVSVAVVLSDGPSEIFIKGGLGVGLVTKPGLPVPVGQSAINPSPREQIRQAAIEALDACCFQGQVTVTISIDNGLTLAKKTLNPRLGIVGGLSILGTSGRVHPYSCQAYQETILAALDVARASQSSVIALTTGGKSERYLKTMSPGLPDECYVQVADFFEFSLKQAVRRGFQTVLMGCFFGKLVKMAQGYASTHARTALIDFDRLALWGKEAGLSSALVNSIAKANTAREVLELLHPCQQWEQVVSLITSKALHMAKTFARQDIDIKYYIFDFQGTLLHSQGRPTSRINTPFVV